MDLERLTPAPWKAQGEAICCGLYKEPDHYLIFEEDGATWADTEFCALARNAFDILLRRGWGIHRLEDGTWTVLHYQGHDIAYATAGDPFTAVIECDEWCKAHVDNQEE